MTLIAPWALGQDPDPITEIRRLAEQGDVDAQFTLGVMYDRGEGVPQDDTEAVRWYRLAADQGHVTAQYNLGFMYDYGEGLPDDYVLALCLVQPCRRGKETRWLGRTKNNLRTRMTPDQIARGGFRRVCVDAG